MTRFASCKRTPFSVGLFRAASICMLTALLACGSDKKDDNQPSTPTPTDPVEVPVITSFTAEPLEVSEGGSTTLTALFSGGKGVVDQGVGEVTSGKGFPVASLNATRTYTLTVSREGQKSATASVTVRVKGKASLKVSVLGLGALPGDFTLSGPEGFQVSFREGQTFDGLFKGEYTLEAKTVSDPAQPGLGRANGGDLGPAHLQRHPLVSRQTVTLGDGPVDVQVVYPPATLSLPIPVKDEPGQTTSMEFVLIPGGAFERGSTDPLDGQSLSAGPVRRVVISKAFYMAKSELTQAQWKAVMGNFHNVSYTVGDDRPIDSVTWERISQDFLPALNAKLSGLSLRLPSEAEWEYACRAGSTSPYFFGGDASQLSRYAALNGNGSSPVMSRLPNAWGLFDMAGNVYEWVEDDAWDGYDKAPADGSAWVNNPRLSSRIKRGGGWMTPDAYPLRSAFREQAPSGFVCQDDGFRLVLDVPSNQ